MKWVDAGQRDLTAILVDDGRRFELGNPAALSVQMLGAGVEYLSSYGVEAIEARDCLRRDWRDPFCVIRLPIQCRDGWE